MYRQIRKHIHNFLGPGVWEEEWIWLLMGKDFILRVTEYLKLYSHNIYMTCYYTGNHWIVCFKLVNFIWYKLYLNKATIIKLNENAVIIKIRWNRKIMWSSTSVIRNSNHNRYQSELKHKRWLRNLAASTKVEQTYSFWHNLSTPDI